MGKALDHHREAARLSEMHQQVNQSLMDILNRIEDGSKEEFFALLTQKTEALLLDMTGETQLRQIFVKKGAEVRPLLPED